LRRSNSKAGLFDPFASLRKLQTRSRWYVLFQVPSRPSFAVSSFMEQHPKHSYHLVFEQCKSQARYHNYVNNTDLVLRMLQHSTIAFPVLLTPLLTPLLAGRIVLHNVKTLVHLARCARPYMTCTPPYHNIAYGRMPSLPSLLSPTPTSIGFPTDGASPFFCCDHCSLQSLLSDEHYRWRGGNNILPPQ